MRSIEQDSNTFKDGKGAAKAVCIHNLTHRFTLIRFICQARPLLYSQSRRPLGARGRYRQARLNPGPSKNGKGILGQGTPRNVSKVRETDQGPYCMHEAIQVHQNRLHDKSLVPRRSDSL